MERKNLFNNEKLLLDALSDSDDLFSSDGEEEWVPDDIVPPSSEDDDYIVPQKKPNTCRLSSKVSKVVQSSILGLPSTTLAPSTSNVGLTISPVTGGSNTVNFQNDETEMSPHVTPEKTRKRKKNQSKRETAKIRRNLGQEYVGNKGITKRKSEVKPYPHSCRYKCSDHFTEEDRTSIFNCFWSLGSWELQTSYICGQIKLVEPKRIRVNANKHNSCSKIITLKNIRVCKEFFLKTLDISNCRFNTATERRDVSGVSPKEKRGKSTPPQKVNEVKKTAVKQHIKKFPKYVSHYSRKDNPHKKYLSPNVTLKQLYNLYCDECKEKGDEPVKLWLYRQIFNTSFNLSFHRPLTDTCDKCDKAKTVIMEGEKNPMFKETDVYKATVIEKDIHLTLAEKASDSKTDAKDKSKKDDKILPICFDLQKTLPTPSLTTNKVYYMRQLWTLNFNVHDIKNGLGYMYIWDETIAGRGSNDVGSCLLSFFSTVVETKGITHVIAFSDLCGGQNKIRNIVKFYMYAIKNSSCLECIDHKFFEPGHSFMECEEDFRVIEKCKKQVPYVFIPSEWNQTIGKASRKFVVKDMSQNDFKSISAMDDIIVPFENVKKDDKGSPIRWRKIKWIRVIKDDPLTMNFKYTLEDDGEFSKVSLKKVNVGRPVNVTLEPLYLEKIPLKYAKWKDLQNLLPYVPPCYHGFYQNLPHFPGPDKKGK